MAMITKDFDAKRRMSKFDIGVVVAIATVAVAVVISLFLSHM